MSREPVKMAERRLVARGLQLYRTILRLHRDVLPHEMRGLGDTYVRWVPGCPCLAHMTKRRCAALLWWRITRAGRGVHD